MSQKPRGNFWCLEKWLPVTRGSTEENQGVSYSFNPGFYLGYLKGRSFPPQNTQLPNKTCCHHYRISEKSSRHDEVSAHTVTFLKIVSQNAPDFISAHILFNKISRGGCLQTPFVAFGHSGLLLYTINPRKNPGSTHYQSQRTR